MRRARFTLDGFDLAVEGYHSGERWNGFAVPYFTFSAMARIATTLHIRAKYSEERDAWRFDNEGEREWFPGAVYDTEDGPMRLYPIQGRGWLLEDGS